MLSRIGILILILGLTMADSECLLIPVAVMALGAVLIKIGYMRGELEEDNE